MSAQVGRHATLDDISDLELDTLRASGFDWLYLLSVWQTGIAGQRVSRTNQTLRREFEKTLHDLREEDIAGSGFAITKYTVLDSLGGDEALARLRTRMAKRGLLLMLDFVPNHVALDHAWVQTNPDFFVAGTEEDLERHPQNFTRVPQPGGSQILAYGRDPYFPGWYDTLQLQYANPALQQAMVDELLHIAERCDGVRCDMAMLLVPEVFERTWAKRPQPFWPQAIKQAKDLFPGMIFVAEVYWDMERDLQDMGFDYTYDKRLYDRLHTADAPATRSHFLSGEDFQLKLVRFLENHDEVRAAQAFTPEHHEAAGVLTYFSQGLRFFHQGQMQGWRKRISPHLVRFPQESTDGRLEQFYDKLLHALRRPAFHSGRWLLLECHPAWNGNESHQQYVAFGWQGGSSEYYLVAVNLSHNRGQCFVKLPFAAFENSQWRLKDLFSDVVFERDGNDLTSRGLFLDEESWKYYVFEFHAQIA